ncbi:NAD(P)/FAD-dependent oxidoreductase [Tropicimonas sp. IMCC34043]|uniref:dihydrolipoyl dehydrogenase family protein n=1 Tax=Tropicimonas sp. IMCC34043 TaxID=2248760 RepID=UPI000E244545|nr:FAD-dependent oxidoreductase [Tropicimonas sp. IMCC34043]
MEQISCDLCILGAGSAGLSLAAGAAQMGASVVLLERGAMGGDCLNTGCVPSKALIAAANRAQGIRAGGLGIKGQEPSVNFAEVMGHVRGAIATIAPHDSQERFEGLGVRVIRAHGRFVAPDRVETKACAITARRFVIATGSSPAVPPVPGLPDAPYLTNETLFDLQALPEHLIILGGGPVGLEMAQAFRRLGARVTVIEAARALGREDPDLAVPLTDALRAEGIEILEQTLVERVRTLTGEVVAETSGGPVAGSHLLVAAGRVPNTGDLGLDTAGIRHDRRGITVDAGLRTTNRRVYAIGDVAGQGQFTHLAGYHASVIARSILFGLPAKARHDHIPRVTYTDPELAQIGPTEAEARAQHGARLEVLRVPFGGNDRAVAQDTTAGQLKLMVLRGRPVGVSILGPDAGELIAPWALVLANRLKLKAVSDTVLPYPTLGEINKRAAGAYFSPRLFDSPLVKKVVAFVQRHIP